MSARSRDDLLDFGQAYRKAADYCALQDRCKSEMQQKLRYWNIDKGFINDILAKLVDEGFLNEKRFAINYAGGKFRIKCWGKLKIAAGLRDRSVPAELVKHALSIINEEEYTRSLETLLHKKLKLLGDTPANRQKALYFAASRGFEPGLIAKLLKNSELLDSEDF
jgi:regulatory protein